MEREVAALKARVEAQVLQLARITGSNTDKKEQLGKLLDLAYALDVDSTQKRVITDTCKKLIKTTVTEMQLNMELTEADSAFLSTLQKRYPNLNHRELKISLLVKLNYETKEIARSIGVSTRGMETIRYKIHKKLGIGKHISMKNYLTELVGG
ncbi:helix-turn-helix transcriptional regulator [Candidatus Chlorobium masyuteum]|uniref:helix-turn-helix transcriptional regulator n=1 Tax=Candidatus Chlorobium masyuteum TaxID=2716876 RepID=UPI001F2E2FDE|nr:hypothetical protein [Candidatus Chlorobium masyuteum]